MRDVGTGAASAGVSEPPDTQPVVRVLAGYDAVRSWQEELYRALHQHPELPLDETETATTVADALRKDGYEVQTGIGVTGVMGVLRNGDGPTVLARADMDALPMKEDTGLPYASTARATDSSGEEVPVAHACGHDVHVACLLGAARLLAGNRSAWRGTFIALFQPAEETAAGARGMVDDGLTDRVPKPNVALAQHVLPFPAGTVGTHTGPILSTAASMRITVHGRGSHGSMPQRSVDPVVLASMIVVRLQTIVAREVAPGQFAVVTVGRLSAGSKSNIISDRATIELNIRAYDDATRAHLLEAIRRIVKAECEASAAPQEPEFEVYDEYPLTANDPAVTARVASAFAEHFGDGAITIPSQSASEDFSVIPDAFGIPYTFWAIGGSDPEAWHRAEKAGTLATDIPANHSPRFAPLIQPTLETGTAAIIVAALAWLGASGAAGS